ncbi:MAG: ATP-binding protein [Vicinamibacteria bacterium]|nr:ATP-binding protein [Vicinamibacteria bacterium]
MSAGIASESAQFETLAAGLAHTIRNQLNSLQIHVQLSDQDLREILGDDGHPLLERLRRMDRTLIELDGFLSEFLLYVHPPAMALAQVALAPLVQSLATFLAPEFALRQVALVTDLAQAPEFITADAFHLKRALLNLTLNALAASNAGSTVTISAVAAPDGGARIAVRDLGSGIPAALRPRLFEPFASAHSGSAGLGLPIAQRIIDAHGGRVEVETYAGRGSVFTVILPGPEQERARG